MKHKLKYQGGITKKICLLLSNIERKKFSRLLKSEKIHIPAKNTKPDFDVISFSGAKDFEEQILSVYSFLYYIGTPKKWIIYSDGSYTESEKTFLQKKFLFLECKEWNYNKTLESNTPLKKYLEVCHLSKKLHAIAGHNYERQTVYADSDIIFYKNAYAYFDSDLLKEGLWYIADTNWGTVEKITELYPLNSGLMILNKNFNFELNFQYLNNLQGNYEYFSEQSSFNYSFKKQDGNILDPRQFIVNTEDQFDFRTAAHPKTIALRHFVNPVRHKIWQKGWGWHFKA